MDKEFWIDVGMFAFILSLTISAAIQTIFGFDAPSIVFSVTSVVALAVLLAQAVKRIWRMAGLLLNKMRPHFI